jgi:hypothetical protein
MADLTVMAALSTSFLAKSAEGVTCEEDQEREGRGTRDDVMNNHTLCCFIKEDFHDELCE